MAKTQKESILINTRDTETLLEDFTDEEAGAVFKALLAYANRGEEFQSDDRSLRTLFRTIQSNVDRNNERYEDTCEKRKKAIAKRWEQKGKAKKQAETQTVAKAEKAEPIQMYTNDTNVYKRYKCIQKIQMYTNDTDSDSECDSERDSVEPNGSVNIEPNGSKQKQSFCKEAAAAEACAREGEEPLAAKEQAESEEKRPESCGKQAKGAEKHSDGEPIDFERVRLLWNETVNKAGAKMPKLSRMTDRRMALVRARARDSGADSVYKAIEAAARSDFLNHGSRTGKAATFEWLFEPEHFTKVLEGYFDNPQEPPPEQPQGQTSGKRRRPTQGQATAKGYSEELERNDRQAEAEREKRKHTANFMAVLGEYGVKPWESSAYKDLFEAGLSADELRAEMAKRTKKKP